jgi:hypothetical protein
VLETAWNQTRREEYRRRLITALEDWFQQWRFSDRELPGFVDLWIRDWVMNTLQWWREDPHHDGWFHRFLDPVFESFSILDSETELIGTRGAYPYEPEPLILDFGGGHHQIPADQGERGGVARLHSLIFLSGV